MIVYDGLSDDKKCVFYYSVSETPIQLEIKVYEGYTNAFYFHSEIEVHPNCRYYTFIPATWKNRHVLIYDKNTKRLLAPFVIDGHEYLQKYDEYGYLQKLFKVETNESCQAGINDVIREHFHDRQYRNIVDVEEGDVVVDIGFNYGIFSLGALHKGASKIYGFEPNRNIFEKIVDIYPETDKVEIFNLAVSDKNEKIIFNEGYNTLSSSINLQVPDYHRSYNVDCVNFYDFIVENQIDKIDFLKVDCEGAEYSIIQSIPDEFFSKIKRLHIEYHGNSGTEVLPIIEKLEKNGFSYQYESGHTQFSEIGLIFAKKIT